MTLIQIKYLTAIQCTTYFGISADTHVNILIVIVINYPGVVNE